MCVCGGGGGAAFIIGLSLNALWKYMLITDSHKQATLCRYVAEFETETITQMRNCFTNETGNINLFHVLKWGNLKKISRSDPPGNMKSSFSVWLDKRMSQKIISPVVNVRPQHALYIFIRLFSNVIHQTTCVVFNHLERLFFRFGKRSLKTHTLLQQLVGMQIKPKGRLWVDSGSWPLWFLSDALFHLFSSANSLCCSGSHR